MCDDLSFINTMQQTLKPSKKSVSISRMDEKKRHNPGISAEGYWREHEMQVASKRVYWKNK